MIESGGLWQFLLEPIVTSWVGDHRGRLDLKQMTAGLSDPADAVYGSSGKIACGLICRVTKACAIALIGALF